MDFLLSTDAEIERGQARVLTKLVDLVDKHRDPAKAAQTLELAGAQMIGDYLGGVIASAGSLANLEIAQSAPRSFALAENVQRSVADFYASYVPKLVRDVGGAIGAKVQGILERGEREGKNTNELRDLVRDQVKLPQGRTQVIVRTEGTRAASLARRETALSSISVGRGPDAFLYQALRDGRETQVCQFLHDSWWWAENDRWEHWSPKHFSCRSGVTYLWRGDSRLKSLRQQSATVQARGRLLQAQQFPKWIQQSIPGEGSRGPQSVASALGETSIAPIPPEAAQPPARPSGGAEALALPPISLPPSSPVALKPASAAFARRMREAMVR